MKHAGVQALAALAPLLAELRALPGWTERKPGTFYRAGTAMLHFHEAPAGLYADLKQSGRFVRWPVNTPAQQQAVWAA
ncbi:MAG TPA: hypothetical protein VFK82_01770, partial [Burkholderiaceae bacterium]|nr:hypothetical protein [Burkholderiaceae bacterium]